jgi:membrane-associated PAP2 superfamily phosphatase
MDAMAAGTKCLSGAVSKLPDQLAGFTATDQVWLTRQALGLFAMALVLLLVFENSSLDLTLSALAFDTKSQHFPWQHHWFFNDLMYHALKSFSYMLAIPAFILIVLGLRGRVDWLPARNARLAMAGMLLIPLMTTVLKALTNRHCPWDVVDFGGYAPYISLFASTPEGIVRGACFPSGHASAGFVWIVWGLALRATRPVLAKRILLGALLLGSLMGLTRLFQGAHFLSHVLWSAWLAWALVIALAGALRLPVMAESGSHAG